MSRDGRMGPRRTGGVQELARLGPARTRRALAPDDMERVSVWVPHRFVLPARLEAVRRGQSLSRLMADLLKAGAKQWNT